MATIKDTNKGSSNPMLTGTMNSGGSAGASNSRTVNYSSGSTGESKGTGGTTNLQNYINANQGQGEQIAGRVSGQVKDTVQKTEKEAESANTNIANQIGAEKDRLNRGEEFNTQLKTDTGAQNIAGNEADKSAFGNLLNQQNNFQNINQAMTGAQQQFGTNLGAAQKNVENLGTETGRFQLLKDTIKSPMYTTGQQRLDQLLLQSAGAGAVDTARKDLGQQLGTLKSGYEQAQNQFQNQVSGEGADSLKNRENAIAQMLTGTLTGESKGIYDTAKTLADTTNKNSALQNAALEKYFKSGMSGVMGANNEETQAMRDFVNSQVFGNKDLLQEGMRTYNVLNGDNYLNYATQGNTEHAAQDVINKQQQDKYLALMGLANDQTNPNRVQNLLGIEQGHQAKGLQQTDFNDLGLAADIYSADKSFRDSLNRRESAVANSKDYTYAGHSGRWSNAYTNLEANLADLLKGEEGGSDIRKDLSLYDQLKSSFNAFDDSGDFKGAGIQAGKYDNAQAMVDAYKNNSWSEIYRSLQGDALKRAGTISNVLDKEKLASGYNNIIGGGVSKAGGTFVPTLTPELQALLDERKK